jgi:TolA-binding protein
VTRAIRSCPDDLAARARVEALSDLERRALGGHVAKCDLCRASGAVAALFHERDRAASAADLEMVARVARQATARLGSRRGSARRWLAAAALALVFVATGALAWMGRSARTTSTAPALSPRPSSSTRGSQSPPSQVKAATPTTETAAIPDPGKPRLQRRRSIVPLVTAGGPAVPPVNAVNAAALFAQAGAARRAGDLREAAELYRSLRRRFPGSSEARLSAFSLGDLLLDVEAPSSALDAFDAYLTEAPSGSLREEALFGRARCLRALGRRQAEEATWERLVREFPRSAYEPLARRRVAELRR